MLITLYAHAQIYSVFGFAVSFMPHVVFFAFPARKKLGINDMVTTHTVYPASAWATPAEFWLRFSDYFVATYFRLTNEVSKVGVPFVADYWSFRELIGGGGVYL